MPLAFDCLSAVYAAPFDTLIDVRSPAEFAEDHIPGATSLPVLSDRERAEVGTIYTQVSPFKARKIGAALVARNAAQHIESALADYDGSWRPLVYCWRGGQRSGSFASILSQIGWRTETLAGGYQSYRRLVADLLHRTPLPHRLIMLDGNTGTAKTEILARLKARGVQVIDLEALAEHRGSVFGALSDAQPAQKGFESRLAQALSTCDPGQQIVVEAESSKIGNLLIPPQLWKVMREAPRIRLRAPISARARYITQVYSDLVADPMRLSETLDLLVPFHGHDQVNAWRQLAQRGDWDRLASELIERHYDPRYSKARMAGQRPELATLDLPDLSDRTLDATAVRIGALLHSSAFRPQPHAV